MGAGFEVISTLIANPGAGPTAAAAATGDSLTVRSADVNSNVWLEDTWGFQATAGFYRITSPRLHDNVQGLRFRQLASLARGNMPDWASQRLIPQDQLTVAVSGGGAETDTVQLLIYYENLPGVNARLATWEQVQPRIENIYTNEVAVTAPATLAQWGPALAFNATLDLSEANRDYALLGYTTDVSVAAVGFKGIDTGNLRVGGPGTTERLETREWFIRLGVRTGRPHIPIFNAANKAGILLDTLQSAAGVTVNVTMLMALLRP